MNDELQLDGTRVPDTEPTTKPEPIDAQPASATVAPVPPFRFSKKPYERSPVKIGVKRSAGRPTKLPSGVTQREAKKNREYMRDYRAEKKEVLDVALSKNNYLDEREPSEDEAKKLLTDVRHASFRHIDQIYKLAIDAAREFKLTANRFYFVHGADAMLKSMDAKFPVLREEVEDGEVPGQLVGRADLHCFWDYAASVRDRSLTFDGYLQLIFDVKNDFFVLNDVCEKDFDRESYDAWVELMPKLDPTKLKAGYTQREMREFLNVSEVKQRLLVASRNSMKSSFSSLWTVQQLLICPDLRVLLLSETKPLSREFVRQLRGYFEVNAGGPTRLQQLFPMYMIEQGDGKETELRSPMAHLNLTIGVVSSSYESGGFAGMRNDFSLHDDTFSNDTVGTADQIQKTINKYDAIRKLCEVGSLGSILICTPWHIDDLAAELQRRNEQAIQEGNHNFLSCRIDPAFEVLPHARAKAAENLLSLEESDVVLRFKRLDWKFLRGEMQAARNDNGRFFRSQHLCSWSHLVDDSSICTFTLEDLEAATHPLSHFEPYITSARDHVLCLDLAYSTSARADFSSLAYLIICQREKEFITVVRNVDLVRLKISDLAVKIVETLQANPRITRVVAEKTGSWQSLFSDIQRTAMLRGLSLAGIDFKFQPVNQHSSKDKVARIKGTCESMLNSGKLLFVRGSWNSATFSQFIDFEGAATVNNYSRKSDAPDSIALGIACYYPGMNQSPMDQISQEEQDKQEQAATLRLHYDRMFGNQFTPTVPTAPEQPERDPVRRGVCGIPGIGSMFGSAPSAPKSDVLSWGQIHKRVTENRQ